MEKAGWEPTSAFAFQLKLVCRVQASTLQSPSPRPDCHGMQRLSQAAARPMNMPSRTRRGVMLRENQASFLTRLARCFCVA